MKVSFLLIFVSLILGCNLKQSNGETYKVMTYNIRYDNPDDGENNWHKRKAELVTQIKKEAPDFLGTQEVLVHQLQYLDSMLTDCKYVGVGREDGKTKGEFAPLFYDVNKWRCLRSSTFWLSETPDTISVGWDAALERICTYALLENKTTNKKVWVLNTHFDHAGDVAREKSAELLLAKIGELQQSTMAPVILMGDFNVTPEKKPIQLLLAKLKDSFKDSESKQGTFNNFSTQKSATHRIDYIFTKNLNVKDCEIITEKRENGHVLSDHFPVLITFEF